ncbi:type I-MYXAN CRISPR-associated protein Cmx8 [candidate division KSB1 bacterium]|nr:type I-MYXAN CRISPR-associated protein Cmx8 [candidate division KSB1 bacterium]
MAKAKKTTEKSDVLELDYQLAELPSSQHRAGLAGLVLMVEWLKKLPEEKRRGICEITRLDERGATLKLNQAGLADLFNEVYAASKEEQPRDQPLKNKQKEIIPPLREETRTVTDDKGKTKEKTNYIYEVVVPRGAFLASASYDKSFDGKNGIWIKLWRDLVWSIFRGVPATRKPYEDRANGEPATDAADAWQCLLEPSDYTVDLPSTYFIGAQAANAENVPFKDRARLQFLLHFWQFIAQIYVPAVINNEGKRDFVGYALAIPDVAELETFCEDFPQMMRERGLELSGYRPRDCVVDLAVESALDLMRRLQDRLAVKEGEKNTHDLILGADVVHLEKQGNNVRLWSSSRLDPDQPMINAYANWRGRLWDPTFRRQRLLNLVKGSESNRENGDAKPAGEGKDDRRGANWYDGFDAIFGKLPYEQTINAKNFRHDARESFAEFIPTDNPNKEDSVTETNLENPENGTATETKPITTEYAIYQLVGTYLSKKLKGKYGLEWNAVKGIPAKEKEYGEMKEKVARDAFLAIRSRSNQEDFIEYFVSTICSVSQRLNQQAYLKVAEELFSRTEDIRTLTMLALSARG